MAIESIRIPKKKKLTPSTDFESLRQEGIDLAQELSGDLWTDFNEHDPGVTILENLCYAITELGYKANLPLADLLFGKSDESFDQRDNALFPAAEVLPASPLTLLDYRRILIDQITGIRNAWITTVEKSELGLNISGLYKVFIQLDTSRDPDPKAILEQARELLASNRNLGEDFDSIEILDPEMISFQAEINLSPHVVPESLLAELLFRVAESLTPKIRFQTLEELIEQGDNHANIFNGPLPKHGFVKYEDLRKSDLHLLNTVHKSRLIQILTDLDGIVSVNNFRVLLNGSTLDTEITNLGENAYAELDIPFFLDRRQGYDENYPIKFLIGDLQYELDLNTASNTYDMLLAKHRLQYERPLELHVPPPTASRKLEEVEAYHSIQNSFPEVYGIGDLGLPTRAPRERKAHAKQLQAYLMFYEQLMANYLSQLVHVRSFFSTDLDIEQTYFSQPIYDVPGAEDILGRNKELFAKELDTLVRQFDPVIKRRNRFLDHLLARFGEEFMTDSFNTLNRKAAGKENEGFEQEIIKSKVRFLQNYISISRERGKGYNYLKGAEDPQNVSGLKKRISLLFGFQDYQERPLSQILKNPRVKVSAKSTKADKGNSFVFKSKNESILADILANGVERNHYRIDTDQAKVIFVHPDTKEEMEVYQGENIEACEEGLSKLIAYLRELNAEGEGFHLMEHVLLRPIQSILSRLVLSKDGKKYLETGFTFKKGKENKKSFVKQLQESGIQAKNYSVEKDSKDEGMRVVLKNKDGVIIGFLSGFLTKELADNHIKSSAALIKKEAKNLSKLVDTEDQTKAGAEFSDDPYSSLVSIVLPAWTARFRNDKLRTLLEHMVRYHAPAHLSLQFHWVGLKQMQGFEHVYQEWKVLKSQPLSDQSRMDALSYHLMVLLKHFYDPEDSYIQEELDRMSKLNG
ncbi:MAG: hypothetical protein AAF587_21955 [Bacteroidota bacterium]